MVAEPNSDDSGFLAWRKQQGAEGKYTLVNPHGLYRGKSYSEWATDWLNWYLSANADSRNYGPVVFLRSHGLPKSKPDVSDQVNGSGSSAGSYATDFDYPAKYANDPNIRVGKDRLQIFDDQAVFVPIIVAYQLGGTVAQYRDWGNMQDFTGLLIDIGDNPPGPYQLTIDNISMHLEDRKGNAVLQMKDFRIATPVFTALVPEAPYGTSVKDFLEEGPIPSGSYPAMVDGYFVMLKFTPGSYWVHSWASAGREPRGPYFSELLYQIEVATRPPCVPHGSITAIRPARNQAMFARIQKRKLDRGEFSPGEADKMAEYLGSMQELKYRVTLKSTKQVIISLKDKIGPKQTEELENLIPKPKDKIKPEQVDKFIKSAEELTESITRKDEAGIKQKIQGLKEIFKHER